MRVSQNSYHNITNKRHQKATKLPIIHEMTKKIYELLHIILQKIKKGQYE